MSLGDASDIQNQIKGLNDDINLTCLLCGGTDDTSSAIIIFLDKYIPMLRIYRNSSTFIAPIVESCNIIQACSMLFDSIKHHKTESTELTMKLKTFVTVCCQLFANYCICGDNYATHYWTTRRKSFTDDIVLITSKINSKNALSALIASIYYCCHADNAPCLSRLSDIMQDRQYWCLLLLAVVEVRVQHTEAVEAADPSMEWLLIFLQLLVRRGRSSALFLLIQSQLHGGSLHLDANDGTTRTPQHPTHRDCDSPVDASRIPGLSAVTYEQLVFLNLLRALFEDRGRSVVDPLVALLSLEDSHDTDTNTTASSSTEQGNSVQEVKQTLAGSNADTRAIAVELEAVGEASEVRDKAAYTAQMEQTGPKKDLMRLLLYIAKTADNLFILSIDISAELESVEGMEIDAEYKAKAREAALPLCLEVLASALALAPFKQGSWLRRAVSEETDIIPCCSTILQRWGYTVPISGKPSPTTASSTAPLGANAADLQMRRETVRGALRLLGNLCYGCPLAQDKLRRCGGLAAVLSNCATDFGNPLAREWALLCVRNACASNEENQAFIEELKPQRVLQDSALLSQGIKVDIDPMNGKFKFSQDHT